MRHTNEARDVAKNTRWLWFHMKRKQTDQVHEFQPLQEFAVLVFQTVGFVNHHTSPVELPQLRAVGHYHLESGDQPVKLQHAGDGVPLRMSDGVRIRGRSQKSSP